MRKTSGDDHGATRPARWRVSDTRGIVTIEFACGILASIIVMIMLGWAIFLFGVKIKMIDVTGEIARQAARGDQAATRTAEQRGPQGARYLLRRTSSVVEVTGTVQARPLAGMPAFSIEAVATAELEPTGSGG